MGNRALRRQQAKTKERTGSKSGGGGSPLPRTSTKSQSHQTSGGGGLRSFRPKFFMDIWSELKKVSWPDRRDVMHLTVVIVIVTIIMGAVLGAIDLAFGWLVDQTLLN